MDTLVTENEQIYIDDIYMFLAKSIAKTIEANREERFDKYDKEMVTKMALKTITERWYNLDIEHICDIIFDFISENYKEVEKIAFIDGD